MPDFERLPNRVMSKSERVEKGHARKESTQGRKKAPVLEQAIRDYADGKDTEGANRVRSEIERIRKVREDSHYRADLLKLDPKNKKRAQREATQNRKKHRSTAEKEAAKKQRDIRLELGHDHVIDQDPAGAKRIDVGFDGDQSYLEKSKGAVRRTVDDPLLLMLNRGQLTPPQYEAAEKIRTDYEIMARHGLKGGSFDEAVDGGKMGIELPAYLVDATNRIASFFSAIGEASAEFIRQVVIDRMSLRRMQEDGLGDHRANRGRLAALLDAAAVHYGILAKAREKPPQRHTEQNTFRALKRVGVPMEPLSSSLKTGERLLAVRFSRKDDQPVTELMTVWWVEAESAWTNGSLRMTDADLDDTLFMRTQPVSS